MAIPKNTLHHQLLCDILMSKSYFYRGRLDAYLRYRTSQPQSERCNQAQRQSWQQPGARPLHPTQDTFRSIRQKPVEKSHHFTTLPSLGFVSTAGRKLTLKTRTQRSIIIIIIIKNRLEFETGFIQRMTFVRKTTVSIRWTPVKRFHIKTILYK